MTSTDRPWLVMSAGPYMSGTGGDPAKIAANRARLEAMALPIYERGHLPLIGVFYAGCTLASAVAFHRGKGGMWKGRAQASVTKAAP